MDLRQIQTKHKKECEIKWKNVAEKMDLTYLWKDKLSKQEYGAQTPS